MAGDGSLDASRPRRVGIVVVHGVGETKPGYCINALFKSLVDSQLGYASKDVAAVQQLDEPEPGLETDKSRQPTSYPVFSRTATRDGVELSGSELFWADTTMLDPGRINTLLGLFRVIFESHHLVDAMLSRGSDAASFVVRKILLFAAWILRGPIAALTIATSAICTVLLFEPIGLRFSIDNAHWKFLIVQALLVLAAIYLFYRILKFQDFTWYDLVVWGAAVAALLFVFDYAGILLPVLGEVWPLDAFQLFPSETVVAVKCVRPEDCYISGLYKVIIWLWRGWGILLLVCMAILFSVWLFARKRRTRAESAVISTSVAILILQFMLWVTIVVTVLYPMLNRAEGNAAINTLVSNPTIDAVKDKVQATFANNNDVLELFKLADIHPDWISRFKFIYVAATLTVVIMIIAALALMQLRSILAHAGTKKLEGEKLAQRLERNARRMPRLLFSSFLVTLLILAFFAVIALVLLQPELEKDTSFVAFRGVFLPAAAALALVVPLFFGHRVSNIVHIARDLIDHHYMPRRETAAKYLPALFQIQSDRPRRERIQRRLVTLLEKHIKDEKFDDVIFVAHSQGSIVAYDYLKNAGPGYDAIGGARPALLTLGSPLGTIYQTYFHEYAPEVEVPEDFRRALRCWVNLYRVDDYIGGRIRDPGHLSIQNRVLKAGGHIDYWKEGVVARTLDELIQYRVAACAPASAPAPHTPASPSWVHAMRGV